MIQTNEPFDTNIYVKLEGFALRFELEKDDFVPEPVFFWLGTVGQTPTAYQNFINERQQLQQDDYKG